ncbi:ABC transporter ATP-binding protein [Alkalibacter saccharofermentans]|jgi:branched-chain amino acid transport system ATP-binding protein|uniref:Amino acid/amide ABC transporter ATP-binding protein 2, HAAT family (TC 3.A.1.4.-) n=1 Tax=Alkalibacter saccharofermentans DSM 14828 TaxID=1120975 RepID=A0A1M4YVL5_9FIRM|nr:ABC transporter ATP-binding protein [Alkalibacter saccharofermentans]SHF09859.1 amino acid/amide ABC transporter ATP-binding protein 2, HAAT family (TC 3.A.1.4.-) [Alkalibacter saccharofermentans DSM 14828]
MLKVQNIDVYYGKIHAIKDISFEVKQGEVVTLIGANGAGKTTILKTLSKVLKPTNGSVFLKGQDIKNVQPHNMINLGMAHAPEGRRIFAQMTVLENLEMGAFIRKESKSELEQDMENVFTRFPRLKERRKQIAGTLSGGEQQMLAIGRALMSKPEILLMDEPSMGLAPILVDQIFNIIEDINKAGTTILLVEQNANRALQIANRAYVLETGKIVAEGDAKELLNKDEIKKAYLGG